MMKTIELEKEEIYCGNLLLVNKNYPLRDNNVKGLVPADIRFPNILMKRDVANVLQLIFEKISAGNSIVPVSGYRSLEEQTAIYDGSLKDNGEDFTRKYVALPNHSEHHTGLAIDLGLNEKEIEADEIPFTAEQLGNLVILIDKGTISTSIGKKVLTEMFENPEEPAKIIEKNGWIQISDEGAIKEVVLKVLSENSNINVVVSKAYENINKYSLERQASEFEKIFKL